MKSAAYPAHAERTLLNRRRFLRGVFSLAALPLLTACGFFSKPVPQQPTPTPTPPPPTPTVTPTRAAVRIDTTVPPSAVSTVSGTPRATPTTNPALRSTGQLLYTGALGGVGGIILADLASDKRTLLTAGNYQYLTWAPDGIRFAAIGAPTAEVPIRQIAIFAADGRALARFSLPISPTIYPPLLWSPNSRALVYQVVDPVAGGLDAWIVDEEGQRPLTLPPDAYIWRWTPGGRLAYVTMLARNGPPSEQFPATFWTLEPQGGRPQQEASGAFYPVDVSPDGATVYAVAGFRSPGAASSRAGGVTTLLALDLVRGTSRTLLDLNAVAAGETAWLANVAAAPMSGLLAICRASIPVAAQQNTIGVINEVLIVDAAGQEVGRDQPWRDEFNRPRLDWSPHGLHLAYQAPGPGGAELRILYRGLDRYAYPARIDPRTGLLLTWSSDDRWLAYVDAVGGLTIAAAGEERAYPFAADGNYPAWRPRP